MMKVPVIFNHHSCEELSEEQKTSLFSGLAETFYCLTNSLKNDSIKTKFERGENISQYFPQQQNLFSFNKYPENFNLLNQFDKGVILTDQEILKAKEFYFKKDSESYPILYYALAKNAITLSAASLEKWKQEFFSFENTEEKLPNAFNCDLEKQIDYLKKQWLKILPFKQGLEFYLKTKIEFLATPSKIVEKNKITIIEQFKKAEIFFFIIDTQLVKQTSQKNVLELILMQKGIRIFFYYTPKIGLLFSGDHYKSSSEKQEDSIKKAQKRIKKHLKK